MSFSSGVKNEICRQTKLKPCCMAAEVYGALLFSNTFSPGEVRVVTENRAFASRLTWLFGELFGFGFDSVSGPAEGEGKHVLTVTDAGHIAAILDRYGYGADALVAHHVNLGVLEEDCCRVSFIRGAFLAGGSVTDPDKRYHLELVTSHYNVARETFSLLGELGFEPGSTSRSGNYITYFKQSAAIEDLLTTIGAPVGAMDMMTAKIEKELRN
ncbi:MAG: DNA-binding protein WhiA, partial [Oscillospiraceae bacterium]|nr:DNA-binding protein WhiA [Oscillospiraceae bacterium]